LDLPLRARRRYTAAAQASVSSTFASVLHPSFFSLAMPWRAYSL
jgi:hypothetical protein